MKGLLPEGKKNRVEIHSEEEKSGRPLGAGHICTGVILEGIQKINTGRGGHSRQREL